MKKTKILILISAVLVVATLLCSCGGLSAANPKKVLTGKYDGAKLLTNATEVNLEKADFYTRSGKFVILGVDDTHEKGIIYNLESNNTVFSYTDTDTTELYDTDFFETDLYDLGLFTVVIRTIAEDSADDKYVTTLYDETGKQIATADSGDAEVSTALDLFTFNGKCYRVAADKTYTELTAWNELIGEDVLDSLDEKTENYYYNHVYPGNNPSAETSITVYDNNLNYISSYRFPAYATGMFAGVLKDGKLLIQYSEKLPYTTEKYSYLDDEANKYNLVTLIFDAKKGKTSEIKSEYVFQYIVSKSIADNETFEEVFDKVKVLALGYEILDGRLDTGHSAAQVLVLNENGKVQSSLTKMFPGMVGMAEPIAENLYSYETGTGEIYVANKDGKVLGNISGSRGMNEKYIFGETKLYNLDMTVAYDFGAQKLSYKMENGKILHTDQGVFFEKEDGSVYFYSGELKEVISKLQLVWKTLTVEDEYFIVRHAEGALDVTYTCFSANGTSLLTTDYEVSPIASYEGVFLFKGLKNGDNVYYRLAA